MEWSLFSLKYRYEIIHHCSDARNDTIAQVWWHIWLHEWPISLDPYFKSEFNLFKNYILLRSMFLLLAELPLCNQFHGPFVKLWNYFPYVFIKAFSGFCSHKCHILLPAYTFFLFLIWDLTRPNPTTTSMKLTYNFGCFQFCCKQLEIVCLETCVTSSVRYLNSKCQLHI